MPDVEPRAQAFVSSGVWIARCPTPWCPHGDHYGPGPQTGRVGGLREDRFHCLYCGNTYRVDWPDNKADIERVLAQRPFPETRNWLVGETIDDLILENAIHGLIDVPEAVTGDGVKVLALATGGRLTELGRAILTDSPLLPQIGA